MKLDYEEQEINQILMVMDTNKDGNICKIDFAKVYLNYNEKIKKKDEDAIRDEEFRKK